MYRFQRSSLHTHHRQQTATVVKGLVRCRLMVVEGVMGRGVAAKGLAEEATSGDVRGPLWTRSSWQQSWRRPR
jgi:hypothetical protein